MKRFLIVFSSLLCLCLSAQAQRRDSVYTRSEQFKWQKLIAPGLLMGAGVAGTLSPWYQIEVNENIRDRAIEMRQRYSGGKELTFDNYLQYAPFVGYAAGMLSGCGEHNFLEQALTLGTSIVFTAIISASMKELCGVERPNKANRQSFPSGHTDTVFLGAELVRLEFGPWWGLAAYSTAFVTAFMRIYNNWHWTTDLMAGAAIGIFCANAAYWMLPLERKWLKLDSKAAPSVRASALPYISPTPYGSSYGMSLALRF